jgi:hypothetical protein
VINAFIRGTTCKELIHTLARETLHMMQELFDVATKYATGEEAIQANFSGKAKAKPADHLSGIGGDDPASS